MSFNAPHSHFSSLSELQASHELFKNALNAVATDPLSGTQYLFRDTLGFHLQKLTSQPIDPQKFFKGYYNPVCHDIIRSIYLAAYIGSEALSADGNVPGLPIGRYSGMLILTAELEADSPTRTILATLSKMFNRVTPAFPVAILYRYNHGHRMAIAACERYEYQQKYRLGERVGKTAILLDVNLKDPSKAHQDILASLHAQSIPTQPGDIESLLKHWRDRLRCQDRDLLSEIAHEHFGSHSTFPKIDRFGEIFGDGAISTIRNTKDWGTYAAFLKASFSNAAAVKALQDWLETLIQTDVEAFYERYNIYPTATVLQSRHRYQDLLLFETDQTKEHLVRSVQNHQQLNSRSDPLGEFVLMAQDSLEHGKRIATENEDEETTIEGDRIRDNVVPFDRDELKKIDVSEAELGSGAYDNFRICRYSVPSDYHKFVFDYLPEWGDFTTIGSIRKLTLHAACSFKSFTQTRQQLLQELQCDLLTIAQRVLDEESLNSLLEPYDEGELTFPIGCDVAPEWLMPFGSAGSTIIDFLRALKIEVTALSISKLRLGFFFSIKGVRSFRVDQLIDLKRCLPRIIETKKAIDDYSVSCSDDIIINRHKLSQRELVTAEKILFLTGENCLRRKDILIDPFNENMMMREQKNHFKNIDFYYLSSIKKKVALAAKYGDESFFVKQTDLELSDLDKLLYQHLVKFLSEPFFKNQDRLRKVIFFARHGFTQNHWRLRDLSESRIFASTVTRELVRQHQDHADKHFLWSLPISSDDIAVTIENKSIDLLSDAMPMLFGALRSDINRFGRFIGFLSGDMSLLLNVDDRLLNAFFAITPGPVRKHEVLKFIDSELKGEEGEIEFSDNAEKLVLEIFDTLLKRKCIELTESGLVLPRKLHPKEAVSHIIRSEPCGLIRDDAISLLGSLNYAGKTLSEGYNRQLSENPYLYLAGRLKQHSIYRHVKFLSVVDENVLKDYIEKCLEQEQGGHVDLRKIYSLFPRIDGFDYYMFRHFVREFSDELSYYFDGKANVDNIYRVGTKSVRINNETRLYKIIVESVHGITLTELGERFHCRSHDLVQGIINNLVLEGKVWKSTPRMFTTPENFRKVANDEERAALMAIEETLGRLLKKTEEAQQILDLSFLVKAISDEFSISFHRVLYFSCVRSLALSSELHVNRSLVSRRKFDFISLTDAFMKLCKIGARQDEAHAAVSAKILATPIAMKRAFQCFEWRVKNVVSDKG